MRRAAGDVVGKTVSAQIRQAAKHLGYPDGDWRPREAWYGRAGAWSAAALDDLRRRYAAWEAGRGAGPLAERVAAVRQALADLAREVEALAVEVARGSDA